VQSFSEDGKLKVEEGDYITIIDGRLVSKEIIIRNSNVECCDY